MNLNPTAADLERLDVLHEILRLLNEPAAGAHEVGRLVAQFPVLAARLDARYRRYTGRSAAPPMALALLGNRVFEEVLLELLEDLTVLRADLDDAKASARGDHEPTAQASR